MAYQKFKGSLVWGLGASFFLFEYFARIAPSVMVNPLMRDLATHALGIGSLSMLFYVAYVGMQLPVGLLVDRFGPHRLMAIMALLCGLSCALLAQAHGMLQANIARFVMGFSAAFAFVGALKLAKNWFSTAHFGFLAGATQALGMVGAALGEGPMAWLVHRTSWRHAMGLIAGLLLLLGVLIALFVRDKPQALSLDSPSSLEPKKGLLQPLLSVMSNPQCWINAVFIGFLYAPTAAFAELWGADYLQVSYHLTLAEAANAISAIFIGWALGAPLFGWLSDYFCQRRPWMLGSALLSLLTLSAVLYMPYLSYLQVVVLLFCYGLFNTGVATSYTVASELVSQEFAGTSMSFANMASVLVGACFQPVIGFLLQHNWQHHSMHGAPIYGAHDFHLAMLSLPGCLLVCLCAGLFLKESYLNMSKGDHL